MVLAPQGKDDEAVTDDDAKYRSGVESIKNGVDIPFTCYEINEKGKACPETTKKPNEDEDDLGVVDFAEDAVFVPKWTRYSYKSVQGKNKDMDNRGLGFLQELKIVKTIVCFLFYHREVIMKTPERAAQKNIWIFVN